MIKFVLALCLSALIAAPAFAAPGAKKSELNGDTVEYNMKTGDVTATGHVVMIHDGAVARGEYATYNTKTSRGIMTGGVVADKDDMHAVCDHVEVLSQTEFVAVGNVYATAKDGRSLTGDRVEYRSDTGYIRMPSGGMITTADGSFTADYMEGWTDEEHAKGVGNAHIVSEPRNFEGFGDEAEYFGKENGKIVLSGNAMAIRDSNVLKSNRITVFLDEESRGGLK